MLSGQGEGGLGPYSFSVPVFGFEDPVIPPKVNSQLLIAQAEESGGCLLRVEFCNRIQTFDLDEDFAHDFYTRSFSFILIVNKNGWHEGVESEHSFDVVRLLSVDEKTMFRDMCTFIHDGSYEDDLFEFTVNFVASQEKEKSDS